jgi:hypothetical protein
MENYVSMRNPLEIDAGGGEWFDAAATAQDTIQTYRTDKEREYLEYKQDFNEKYPNSESDPDSVPDSAWSDLQKQSAKMDQHILDNPKLYAGAKRLPFGYDGIIVKNVLDNTAAPVSEDIPASSPFTTVYVVFKPTQIKSATGNSGSFDPKSPKITRAMRAGKQAATARDCGTGAGGFKPGNKCAGGGGAGAGDSGASGGGSSGSVEQAKPGDGPLVKAAREEHKKALDKMRKAIETAEAKAQAKFQEKWDAHAPLKAKLDDHLALVDKISAEHESLVKQVMADPQNEALAQRMRESGQELLDERVAIEPLEKAEAKARKDREKARHEMRTAVAKALAKESAAVDKEDGLTTAQRKRSLDAVEQTHRSGSQITQWAQEQGLPESISLSQRESAVESRVQAQEFLRSAVNPTIHTRALEGPIEYKDGVRANAAGTAESYESIHGGSSDVRAVVGRTQLSPTDSASTVIHEFGHQIEHGNVEAARLCHDFLQSRVAGEQAVSFSAKFQGYGYGTDEKGSPDDFLKAVRAAYGVKPDADSQYAESIAHYAGKRYEGNGKTSESGFTTYGATEVLSIGLELLAKDARAFAAADPEWFDLVVGISTGRLLNKTRSQRRKG